MYAAALMQRTCPTSIWHALTSKSFCWDSRALVRCWSTSQCSSSVSWQSMQTQSQRFTLPALSCASSAGKSCLVDRYINNAFECKQKNTIGAAFAAKKACLQRPQPVLVRRTPRLKDRLVGRALSNQHCTLTESRLHSTYIATQVKVSSGRFVSLGVWDTAGAERFESLSRMCGPRSTVADEMLVSGHSAGAEALERAGSKARHAGWSCAISQDLAPQVLQWRPSCGGVL